jgi:hypothetical protein
MTYYQDLEAYTYWGDLEIPEILNVGWLGKETEFTQGDVSSEVIQKLTKVLLLKDEDKCKPIVNPMRGFFNCQMCNTRSIDLKLSVEGKSIILGAAEILLPFLDKPGYYFDAPTLIYHYITKHRYIPPQDFVSSLMNFNLEDEFTGDVIFKDLVDKYGGVYIH